MSGGTGARRSRGARLGVWVGAVVGAAAVSGAVLAVLSERPDHQSSTAGDAPADAATAEPGQSQWRHTFPEAYAGPVWITVDSPDTQVRTVTIVWGAWKRTILHEGAEPASYVFTKETGPNIPVAVVVEPDATVAFGSGAEAPAGAEDVNAGWAPNETVEVPSL